MAKLTLQERYEAWLTAMGYEQAYTTSRKYILYCAHDSSHYYYLGRAGSIRYAKKPVVTESISVSATHKAKLIAWEKLQNESH